MNIEYVNGEYVTGARGAGSSSLGYLPRPVGFTFDPGFTIYGDGSTSFDFDAVVASLVVGGVTEYYVSQSGSDSNSGLSVGLPKKGLDAIMATAAGALTDTVRINIVAGDYGFGDYPSSGGVAGKNVIFKVTSGNVRTGPFSKGSALTWTLSSGTCYSATRSNTVGVRDYNTLNAFGDPTKYAIAASLAACQSTPLTYFVSGSTVYVNNGVGQPGANIFVIVGVSNTTFSSNYTWVIDGGVSGKFEFIGGSTGCLRITGGGANQKLYGRNVWFRFSTANNSLYGYGIPLVILQGGGGSGSSADIMNYHMESGRIPNVVEIGLSCYDAGAQTTGVGINNCSSAHDGVQIIRILGTYNTADGPAVADVGDDTKSWNILCSASNCIKADNSSTDANWLASTGTAKMWLDRCTFSGTGYYTMSAGSGSSIYYRGVVPGRKTGTVIPYDK